MDELFDKIKDGASKTKGAAERIAKEVAKRTSNAIASTKLSYSINEANNKIKDIYAEIGETIYKDYLDGNFENSQFADKFEKIGSLINDIDALQAKKAELKNGLYCNKCDTINSTDSDYCAKCGTKLEKYNEFDEDILEDEGIEEIIIEPKQD